MEWIMNWWWATIVGPIVLGGVIAYALLTRRRLTPAEKTAQRHAVRREYGHEDGDVPQPPPPTSEMERERLRSQPS